MPDRADRRPWRRPGGATQERRTGLRLAPWEGRVFGMAVALSDNEAYVWDDFRDRLVLEIDAAEEHGDDFG